jgi:hypothetical protein
MPLRKLKPRPIHPMAETLLERLTKEMRHPSEQSVEPVIMVEEKPSRVVDLYVVWNEWAGFSMEERSEIIMDAYEAAYGLDHSRWVTMAIGVTPEEAPRYNVFYE